MLKPSILAICLALALAGCKTSSSTVESDEASAQDVKQAESDDQAPEAPPFSGCDMRQFTSGWIEAACEDVRFLIQPDRAAMATIDLTWGPMSKALSEEFDADVAGEEIALTVDDTSVPARSFTVAEEDGGDVIVSGIYALWAMGETAQMAAACIQPTADVDRARCVEGFASLKNDGIPGSDDITDATEAGASVVLAGQPLVLGDDCDVASERNITCDTGELTWFQGDAETADEKAASAVADMKEVASAGGGNIDETKRPCQIGNHETTCHVYDIQSDAQHARFHSATVELDGEHLAIACWYDAAKPMPSACEAVFGGESSD